MRTFLFRADGEQQLLLLVQALQEGGLLRVAALPQGPQLIPGLLVLLLQALLSCVALAHLLTQPAHLRLVGSVHMYSQYSQPRMDLTQVELGE